MWVGQFAGWPVAFITPVLLTVLLGLPMPAPAFKGGFSFAIALLAGVWLTTWAILPLLTHQPAVGLLLIVTACFWSFYYGASGGSPVISSFLTMGLAIVTAIGSSSIDQLITINWALTINTFTAIAFMWVAYALFPDQPVKGPAPARPKPQKPSREAAIRSAWRSTVVVLPVILFFVFYAGSASYLAVMIKVSSMGQQAAAEKSRDIGKSLLLSTLIGGIGATIMWRLLDLWPSLLVYVLLVALGGLVMGQRIFQGKGMHPHSGVWSYGYLTMLVIIGPTVMDTSGSVAAGIKFFDRLSMMLWATVYAMAAISIFDAFWHSKARQTVVE